MIKPTGWRAIVKNKDRVNRLAQDKWVRVMCDFSASGIWTKSGSSASLNDLPVDNETAFMLGVWQSWFEQRHSEDPIPSLDRFVSYGWRIVWDIKEQLPDWTVVYFDEKRGENLIGFRLWLRRSE